MKANSMKNINSSWELTIFNQLLIGQFNTEGFAGPDISIFVIYTSHWCCTLTCCFWSLLLIWVDWFEVLPEWLFYSHTPNLKACPKSCYYFYSLFFCPFLLLWLGWWDARARVFLIFFFYMYIFYFKKPCATSSPVRTFDSFKLGPRHLGNSRSQPRHCTASGTEARVDAL